MENIPESNPSLDPTIKEEIAAVRSLYATLRWIRVVITTVAAATTIWFFVAGFTGGNRMRFIWVLGALLTLKFGAAPLFVFSSIGLFTLHVVGVWLPTVACLIAAVSFYVDLRTNQLLRSGLRSGRS